MKKPHEPQKPRRIRDPVHGLIVFCEQKSKFQDETDRIAWDLLNTREFQRLRRIRQLGFSDFVFPGATHSRFVHSIGVYHTARQLIEVIRRRQGSLNDGRAREVLLAALLHDVGHGPFSHAFEDVAKAIGLPKRHEEWSAEIVAGETEINEVLKKYDPNLPVSISKVLKDKDEPEDIYATVVASQFDADRLDYVQRDRLMTGVESAHLDLDWLFDCLEVGEVTRGEDDPIRSPCLYLNRKGIPVAEEYLVARFRLYTMVFLHKTTRAAEKMLTFLLRAVAVDSRFADEFSSDPVVRYFKSDVPIVREYMDIDDASIWATLAALAKSSNSKISTLARRLRHRDLYKCLDVGRFEKPGRNVYGSFRHRLGERPDLLFDDDKVELYKEYDFDSKSALNKVLVKTEVSESDPTDIVGVSAMIQAFRDEQRIRRVYAHDQTEIDKLFEIARSLE